MLMPRVVWMSLVTMMILGTGGVFGQDYPNKPIRIFTSPVGGGSDFISRLIAQAISGPLRQPVIVDNRGGPIAAEIVSKAPPDGYSLLLNAGTWYISSLLRDTPYDPVRDFSSITITSSTSNVLVVHPSLPVKSVKELIALAKARPGELNNGSSGVGGPTSHLAGELFKSMAGVKIVHVPYKGSAASVTALLGGEVQLLFTDANPVQPHLKTGRLRALAITAAQPSVLFPGLPTIAAALPGYEAISLTGVFAPAKTPAAIINRLNQEIVRVLRTAEAKEQFFKTGSDVVGSSPEELAGWIKADMARWDKVIKDAGIRTD